MLAKRIRIAVDMMGGDYAPADIVKGVVMAADKDRDGIEILLVGPPDVAAAEMAKHKVEGLPIRNVPATDVVEEGENPAMAVRRKPGSSIVVATKLVKDGEAEGLISAGPTGAVVTSGIFHLGMIEGVERPVIGGAIFDDAPQTVVFDCGVNMDCKPSHLLTFAAMGSVYCKKLLGVADPAVGLLNIGAEPSKGNHLTKATYPLLERCGLRFIGNIEGFDLLKKKANVIVCDAFAGNVVFKLVESLGLFTDDAGATDDRDLGGGVIWGLNGLVRKIHGHSRAPHVAMKVSHVKQAVEMGLIDAVRAELAAIAAKIN